MNAAKDWKSVWEAAEDARLALGWTKTELYERTGISEFTYTKMRDGDPLKRNDKRHSFAAAFGWQPEDLDRIAAGATPPEVYPPDGTVVAGSNGSDLFADLLAEIGVLRELVLTLASRVDRIERRLA